MDKASVTNMGCLSYVGQQEQDASVVLGLTKLGATIAGRLIYVMTIGLGKTSA